MNIGDSVKVLHDTTDYMRAQKFWTKEYTHESVDGQIGVVTGQISPTKGCDIYYIVKLDTWNFPLEIPSQQIIKVGKNQ